ncbi:MAG: hypothetical protein CMD96_00020 [Gammaproteobacteria bacterium]|jgi:hypothetical protein|nr:hypothetical protein [Gammaproteobacteria bacterium]HJP18921.1 hypothetical protein [Nitrospinota bacterium]|tara:strand:- start:4357 stop:5004 length:648 start_codon:yes stop_codon:yes gene_type:complete
MNFSITIPQLFYDLIARVLPGFLFLVVLKIELISFTVDFPMLTHSTDSNIMVSFGSGIGYVFICYFTGLTLSAFVVQSKEKTAEKHQTTKIDPKYKSISLREMHEGIRLKRPEAGFRLTKLRAEARMFEIVRIGMALLVALTIVLVLVNTHFQIKNDFSFSLQKLPVMLPLILSVSFYLLEKSAWDRYFSRIRILYPIVLNGGTAKPHGVPSKPE